MSWFLHTRRGRHVRTSATRRRTLGGLVGAAALVAAGLTAAVPASAAVVDPCAGQAGGSAPVLRDVAITQGVAGNQPLVRGKTTIVRFFLSAPTCAPAGSQQLISATLRADDRQTPAVTVPTTPSVLGPAYPVLDTYANAPTPNSPANPMFQLRDFAASNTSTSQITVYFTATITYQYVAGTGAAPETRTATYSHTPSDPTRLISATVARAPNTLRVLVVPMAHTNGVQGAPPASQFPTAASGSPLPPGVTQGADTVVQNGMQTLSRLMPIRDGIADLNAPATNKAGLRYRLLTGAALNVPVGSDGKFCGNGNNFDTISQSLTVFLNDWNKNSENQPADKVLGVVWQNASVGGSGADGRQCAEGMAGLPGNVAWTRLLSDNAPDGGSTAPDASPYVGRGTSMTGPIIAMEINHSLGSLPEKDPRAKVLRPDGSIGYSSHSPNVNADGTSGNATYNTTLGVWMSGALSVMRYSGISGGTTASNVPSPWNNNTALFERDDFRYSQCALTPNMTTTQCPYNGSIGTVGSSAAQTGDALMLAGVTNGTIAGTAVHTYRAEGVELTPSDPKGQVTVIQRDSAGALLREHGVALSVDNDAHGTDHDHVTPPRSALSAAVSLAPGAATFELWMGKPPAGSGPCTPGVIPVGGCFYARAAGSVPTLASSTGSSALTNVKDFTPLAAGNDVASAISPDGSTVAWTTSSGIRLQRRDATTGLASGAASAPITGGVQPAWQKDGKRLAYATAAGEIYIATVNTATNPPSVGPRTLVYQPAVDQGVNLRSTAAAHPSFDTTGTKLAIGLDGGVWRVTADPSLIPTNGVICDLRAFVPNATCDVLHHAGTSPSWGWTGGTNGGGLVAFEASGGISTVDPNSSAASPLGYPATPRVTGAGAPAWGGGLLGFARAGNIWVADPSFATGNAWNNQTQLTSTGTDAAPSLSASGGVVSFDRAVDAEYGRNVFTGVRHDSASNVSFTATTEGDPRLLEADVYQSCGFGIEPVAVFLTPTSTTSGPPAGATFAFDYNDNGGCPGGQLLAQVTNGFLTSPLVPIRTFPPGVTPRKRTPAIASPTNGATYFQYDQVIAVASTIDTASGTNPPEATATWHLTGPAGSKYESPGRTVGGADPTRLELVPEPGGWTPGEYTLTLQVSDGGSASTSYVILADPGHKGYNVGVTASPQTLYVPSSGNYATFTVTPQAQKLSQIDPKTVAITEVGKLILKQPIRIDPSAGNGGWVANSDGTYTAKFNRQALTCLMAQQSYIGFYVPVVISGRGSNGVTFTGFDPKYPSTLPATKPVTCS